jgi:hypothetical protein
MKKQKFILLLVAILLIVMNSCTDNPAVKQRGSINAPQLLLKGSGNFGTDLVGWWQFDECNGTIAGDVSGLNNHGTLSGDATFANDALLGCAINLADKAAIISVEPNASLEPATATIEVWIKVAELQNADIVRKTTDYWIRREIAGGFGVYGLRIHTDGRASGFIGNDDPDAPYSWTFVYSPVNLILPGEWHHLTLRWDGNTVDLFIDGEKHDSQPYVPVPDLGLSYHGTSPLDLGRGTYWNNLPAEYHEFTGQLDEVRFYGRARSDVEIQTDFITRGHKPAMPPGKGPKP